MNTTEKQNKPAAEKEKKQLTPQQIQKRKKMVIFRCCSYCSQLPCGSSSPHPGDKTTAGRFQYRTAHTQTERYRGRQDRRLHAGSHAE